MEKTLVLLLLPLLALGMIVPGALADGDELNDSQNDSGQQGDNGTGGDSGDGNDSESAGDDESADEGDADGADEDEIEGDPGVTPDSALWGIDVALDRLRQALASGPAQAQVGLEIAQERLLEIQAMAKASKAEAAEKAEEEHGRVVEKIKVTVEGFDGEDIDNETLLGIERGMANHIEALAKVKARIEANPNIPDEVKAKLIAKFTDLEGRAEELKIKIENKKLQIKLKREAAGSEEEVKLEVEGTLTAEQTSLVGQLITSLESSKTNAEIEIECEAESEGEGNETGFGCKTDVKGTLTTEQESLVDQLSESLESSGTEAKIKIEAEFESGDEDENETDDDERRGQGRGGDEDETNGDEDENETDNDDNEATGAASANIKVSVVFEGGQALVTVNLDGDVELYTFDTKDRDKVVKLVASKTGLSEDVIKANIKYS